MDFESVERNGDNEKFGHFPYDQIEDVVRLAHQSAAEYIFGKSIDILLKKGFQPSEIVDAFADQASQKFKNSKASICLEEAARELFEVERSEQSNS